jgi:hypothetical protein
MWFIFTGVSAVSSVLYEAGYLREYNSFRNVLTYMFTVPLDAKQATFMFRASKSPDSCDNRKVQMYVKYVLLLVKSCYKYVHCTI